MGPPSDIASTTGPPSTIGPSASEHGAITTAKKADFDMKPDSDETSSTSSQLEVPRSDATATQSKEKPLVVEGKPSEGIPQPRVILHMDERRQTHDTTSLEVKDMDITTSEYDMYYGVYPDFQLPLPNRPRISDLFADNTCLLSHTNSPMSILRIPSLRKPYGTTEFAIDRSTGQLYKIGEVDVTPVNLFGGIPDERLHENDVETTTPLLKKPQAMSTPITDTSRSVSFEIEMKDNRPLPSSMNIPISQVEERTKNDMSVVEDVSSKTPIFNLNRANVQVASSVSSLEEGEGIANEDEYEKAVRRLEKINKKISVLLRNWNEESRQARDTKEIVEIEEFYRPYLDQYNDRRKELERLMRLYSEYCTSEALSEMTPQGLKREQQKSPSPFQVQPVPQETIQTQIVKEREQVNQPLEVEETIVKGDEETQPTGIVSSIPSGIGSRSSSLPINTRPRDFQSNPVDTATEGIKRMNMLPQGRMSTLSSVVSHMPTTATRTIAITREES